MLSVNIQKRLGDFSLNVQFETDGEILALLGASGCGKSMTLKCIAGIERPDSGRIVLNDRVLFDSEKHIDLTPQKRRVGYLFQQYALFPNMTVEQNIAAALHRLPRRERKAAVQEKLKAFALEGLEKHRPHQLSGGQQQRAALARIMAGGPEVLLLDEPFSALDSYLKWQMELEMMDTLRAYGGDVLFVSHSRDEVCRMCQTVCVLSAGKSEEKESVHHLMHTPGTVSAALLSGCKNFSRAQRLDDHTVRCIDWGVTLRTQLVPEQLSYVGIRAHYLSVGGEENAIDCRVVRVVEDAFSTVVMLATPGGDEGRSLLRIEMDKSAWAAFDGAAALSVSAAPQDIMLLTGGGI